MTDSSELLEKIWLGNINEKFEVDQDGYDEDTVNGLVRTTRQEKSTIVGDAITEQDTAVTDDADYIPKAANAIDFSKETEVAEEEEDTSKTDVYVAKAKSLALSQGSAQQSTRKVDDDYDEEEEEGEGQAEEKADKKDQDKEAKQDAKSLEEQEQADEEHQKSKEDKGAAPQAPKSQAGVIQAELIHATEASLRKNGLLLLSQMYIGPSIPVRMSKNRKVTHSSSVKMEVMSDDEERFVDEAARRAAAAASLRFRDYHMGLNEPEEEEEDKDEGDMEEEKKITDLNESQPEMPPALLQDEALMPQDTVKAEAQQVQEEAAKAPAAAAFKTLAPIESQMWEDNIIWGSSEEESEREEEEGDEVNECKNDLDE